AAVMHALRKYQKYYQSAVKQQTPDNEMIERLLRCLARPTYKSRLMVALGDRIKYIDIKDIAYFKADGNTVYLLCKDNSRFIVDYTLDEITQFLDPAVFFRLNRSYLANIAAIKDVRKYFNSRLKIFLTPAAAPEDILVSRIRVPDFLGWMNN
ncbi:MAG: LytTR family transcriptional regulator, partial [Bacteroidota bacterium]|nr:LytTR family transcriptional regulator [Bacteroidota bacterium]